MLEILQYATSGFWVCVGCILIIGALGHGAAALVASLAAFIRACRS